MHEVSIINAMTVDVEDYFQVSAFSNHIDPENWDEFPSRIEGNMQRILDLFDKHQVQATFFVLGWLAKRHPEIVKKIVSHGHELASHGYAHQLAHQQRRREFRSDIKTAKKLLEDISGVEVRGYRAPSYSINKEIYWAYDELLVAGYQYSSSTYPIRHDLYGDPNGQRFPYLCRDNLWEIPISTIRLAKQNVPIGGGGYFRLLPYPVFRWGLRRLNHREKQPAVFYFHPWEFDAEQPRQDNVPLLSRFRHYTNLAKTETRLAKLLRDFRWGRLDKIFL